MLPVRRHRRKFHQYLLQTVGEATYTYRYCFPEMISPRPELLRLDYPLLEHVYVQPEAYLNQLIKLKALQRYFPGLCAMGRYRIYKYFWEQIDKYHFIPNTLIKVYKTRKKVIAMLQMQKCNQTITHRNNREFLKESDILRMYFWQHLIYVKIGFHSCFSLQCMV